MQWSLDLLTIKCTQCGWSIQLQPVQDQDALESECSAQPCPACGTEETVIEFLHEAEDWLSQFAAHLHWSNQAG